MQLSETVRKLSLIASFAFMLVMFQRETKISIRESLVFTASDFRHYVSLFHALTSGTRDFFRLKVA